ncbi:MAG: glycerate kinase [Epulopiscium sp. Nele67-Bin002]|nr:MAG: glycerate kinase [Epulopiscium sp. Nele67-Bin002]
MRQMAEKIIKNSIAAVLPDEAVARYLNDFKCRDGGLIVVSIGKAGWQMAKAASEILGDKITKGIVITKYEHIMQPLNNFECYEASHPVPDKAGFDASSRVLELTQNLTENDLVLFLVSGGGSALFENSTLSVETLQDVTKQLLACGADIVEMNTIRKRLSQVKGGKFAKHCYPAKIQSIVLSDIIGNPLDMIASGPAYPDCSTSQDALDIVDKYHLNFSDEIMALLNEETPKELDNISTVITGSVEQLCEFAKSECEKLGFETMIVTDCLSIQAREAGMLLGNMARTHSRAGKKLAFIAGGETVVKLTGEGKGGRNQELALAAAPVIDGLNACVFSVGSDGTDGPTDAAGGFVDGTSNSKFIELGIDVAVVLQKNDAYNALQAVDGLIITGPTGTNVNDVAVVLIENC